VVLKAPNQTVFVKVIDKRDASLLKNVVGHMKNGFGMKTAEIVSDKDCSMWVRDCIVQALKQTGVKVVADERSIDNKSSRVFVDLQFCYAQPHMWNIGGEVTIALNVSKGKQDIIKDKQYAGNGTHWESFQRVFELAMQDLMQKMMPDIIQAINTAVQDQPSEAGDFKDSGIKSLSDMESDLKKLEEMKKTITEDEYKKLKAKIIEKY